MKDVTFNFPYDKVAFEKVEDDVVEQWENFVLWGKSFKATWTNPYSAFPSRHTRTIIINGEMVTHMDVTDHDPDRPF